MPPVGWLNHKRVLNTSQGSVVFGRRFLGWVAEPDRLGLKIVSTNPQWVPALFRGNQHR